MLTMDYIGCDEMEDRNGNVINVGDQLIHVDRPSDVSSPVVDKDGILWAGGVKVSAYHSSVIEIYEKESECYKGQ